MPDSSAAFARAPLKQPESRPADAAEGEDESERNPPFAALIPGPARRFLFKRPKGRLGMG